MIENISMTIQTPTATVSTALRKEEFSRYIGAEIYEKYAKDNPTIENVKEAFLSDVKSNFNNYAPIGKDGYSVTIDKVESRKVPVKDINMDRLTFSEYVLTNYENPNPTLANITEKLYEYKYIFNDNLLYLTSIKSIGEAKKELVEFDKKMRQLIKPPESSVKKQNDLPVALSLPKGRNL